MMVKGLEVIQDSAPWAYRCFHEKTSASGRGRQDLVLDDSRVLDRDKSRILDDLQPLHHHIQRPLLAQFQIVNVRPAIVGMAFDHQ